MSVIFGIHEADRIIIVTDNRTTNKDEEIVSDASKKIYPIHSGLCIAMAGHRILSEQVKRFIARHIIETHKILTTDDISMLITRFFDELSILEKKVLPLSFSCVYGGLNCDGKASLIFGSYNNENDKYICREEAHYSIISPADTTPKHCYGALAINCVQMKKNYPEIILHEIASQSKLVSSSGDMWVFDIPTQKGTLTKIQGKEESR